MKTHFPRTRPRRLSSPALFDDLTDTDGLDFREQLIQRLLPRHLVIAIAAVEPQPENSEHSLQVFLGKEWIYVLVAW